MRNTLKFDDNKNYAVDNQCFSIFAAIPILRNVGYGKVKIMEIISCY